MIPFLDLVAQHRALRPDLDAAIGEVLDGAQFVLGEPVARFERAFAGLTGTRHAIAVSSGTAALHLALVGLDIGPGDEVITTPMTFVATVAAIVYAGARPVLADVDRDTLTLDPERVEPLIGPRTRAIVPVHLHGQVADMDGLGTLARRHGLALIEDAAQAHGATFDERPAGSLGDVACFSFYPGKNLGACGEGGAIVTSDDALAERLRRLRDWGQSEKYLHVEHGFNYRMDGIQGAVLGVKLPHLAAWTEARRALAGRYDAALAGLDGLRTPHVHPGRGHVRHVYAVRARRRDDLRRALTRAGIGVAMHYPAPVHLQPAYASLGYGPGDFPVSERYAAETLSLPLFPELTSAQVDEVAGAVRASLPVPA